jgi:hypothetical protein
MKAGKSETINQETTRLSVKKIYDQTQKCFSSFLNDLKNNC